MKTKLIFLLLVSSLLMIEDSKAQLAEGSTAPDFTAEDIQGNTHRLYAYYLNNGMPVIIDISATWCSPCWSYHKSHELKDLYNLYGANGSNEVGVLFVEGDASTDLDDLNGTGDNTYGDWVTGTPYPIIDDAAVSDSFEIGYYPTIYGICPDGSTYEFGQKTTSQIISLFESKCGFTAN